MKKPSLPLLCALLLATLLFPLSGAVAQPTIIPSKGKSFWLGFMRNWGGWAPPYTLDIIISSNTATSGTVRMPRLGHQWPFSVVPGTTVTVSIPVDIGIHQGSEFVDDRSVFIEALDSIAVFAVNYESYSTDGTVVYPQAALGTDYRVMAYSGMSPGPGVASEFLIVATKDGTEVEVTTTAITASGNMPNTPWTVQLDSGQTYQVQAFDPLQDFTGSTVRATEASGPCRPFAVFGGSACAEVPTDCWACDHLYQQLLPVNVWGTTYHVVPFLPPTSYLYRVLAHEDGTQVSINGAGPITLAAGQYIDDLNATTAVHVQADRPVAVAQYMKGFLCSGAGDPSMLMLNADHQRMDHITFSTVVSTVVDQNYLTIVVATADVGTVTLDGAPVPEASFTPFPSDPFMQYARMMITPGSHTLACPGGVIGYVYGTGEEESYAYSVGANTVVPAPDPSAVICGTAPDGTVTLVAPADMLDPVWTTYIAPDAILHQGASYQFTPTTTQAYVATGTVGTSGCPTRYIFSVELDVPPQLVVSSAQDVVCAYGPVQLGVQAGPMGNYAYVWTPASTLDDPASADPMAHPVMDTWYHVTVSTPSGCATASGSVFVQVEDGAVVGVSADPGQAAICSGQPVQLEATALQVLYADDLDDGIGELWLNAQGWELGNACGSITGDALYFNGAGDRFVETIDLDLVGGAVVRFALSIGAGEAPCEDADPGDDVVLEYSTNGGVDWTQLGFYIQWAYPEMTPLQVPLPVAALTPATRLRWRQSGNWSAGTDNWSLDHVSIIGPGNAGLSFLWSPALGLSNATAASPLATPMITTTYRVTVGDPASVCAQADSVHIEVTRPEVEIFDRPELLCEHGSVVLDAGAHPGYLWSTGATTSSITVDAPGRYVVQVLVDGCLAADTAVVEFAPMPGGLQMEVPRCGGPTWTLTIPVEGGSYLWSNGDTARSIVVEAPGDHTFVVVDTNGCSYSGAVALVPMEEGGVLTMPNVLTPNGDGRNDLFEPFAAGELATYRLQVYNRWGQMLFDGVDIGWNGRTDGDAVPAGTYFFIVDYRSRCGDVPGTLKGALTLLR